MITKKKFQSYVDVQMSGITNMFDVRRVSELSGLGRDEIIAIMKQYGELTKKYPDVDRTGNK